LFEARARITTTDVMSARPERTTAFLSQDPAAFRRLFCVIVGLSAGEYRRRFTAAAVVTLAA
jgi:hypothetical protein